MPEYQTNVIVSPHNVWSLTKHAAGSLNKAAAKLDAKVYGTATNTIIVQKPTPPPPKPHHPVLEILGAIGMTLLLFAVFIGLLTGKIRMRDCVGP